MGQASQPKRRRRPLVIIGIVAAGLVGLCLGVAVFGALAPNRDEAQINSVAVTPPTRRGLDEAVDVAQPAATPTDIQQQDAGQQNRYTVTQLDSLEAHLLYLEDKFAHLERAKELEMLVWSSWSAEWNQDLRQNHESFDLEFPAGLGNYEQACFKASFDIGATYPALFILWQEYDGLLNNRSNEADVESATVQLMSWLDDARASIAACRQPSKTSDDPSPTPPAEEQHVVVKVKVTQNANLRSGPGTDYAKVGSTSQGDSIELVARNATGDWYQSTTGAWIAGFLVEQPPADLSLADDTSASIPSAPRLTAATSALAPANIPVGAVAAQLARVVDGDTIDVLIDGQRATLRYIGIDTPENNSQIGVEAANANADLLAGEVIYLKADTTDRDQYNRLLRYVYLPDGRMVNEELVLLGYALSVAYPPDTAYQADFDAAQRQAQTDRVGMWKSLAWAARSANIRTGPGTNYAIVDGAQLGEALDIVGRNSSGDWFKLGTGGWISAQLVSNPPSNLPVVQAPLPPTATPGPQRSNPPAAATRPAAVCQCSGVDYDCGNFGSWASAQACFRYCLETVGYDVHRLDRDNDGIACESLR